MKGEFYMRLKDKRSDSPTSGNIFNYTIDGRSYNLIMHTSLLQYDWSRWAISHVECGRRLCYVTEKEVAAAGSMRGGAMQALGFYIESVGAAKVADELDRRTAALSMALHN